ncbi:MAG: TetR/AcrR family transcriptional regulator [Oscillospiraceae bacterium]|nr:TetR/AcrR family transcriptional regulator [Oscillospiraceae bacterium]
MHHKLTFDNIPPEKRARVIDAATKEFAKKGYHDASVSSIAAKAGISVGAIYKYFENKQDLFLTIIDESIVRIENLLLGLAKTDEDVMIKVEKILREIISVSREDGVLINLYNSMTSINDKKLASQFAKEMEQITAEIYTRAIIEGQANGEIRKDIDPKVAAFLIDDLFMSLQFSFANDYYIQRFKIYCGENAIDKDEFIIHEVLKFVKSALKV